MCPACSEHRHTQFVCRHVHHRDKVFNIAVTTRPALGRLHQTVYAFQQAVGHFTVKPSQDAFLVLLDRLCQFNHRRELRAERPNHPFPKVDVREDMRCGPKLLHRQLQAIGTPGLQIAILQPRQRFFLPAFEVGFVLQPDVLRIFNSGACFCSWIRTSSTASFTNFMT